MYRRIIYTWILLITLASSITTLVDAVKHLEILYQPLDRKVIENRRIKLSCRVSHLSNKFIVDWYKDEQVIASGQNITGTRIDKQRFFITGDSSKGQYNLRIQNAQPSDTGNYTCRIYRTLDRTLMVKSRAALVQVVYTPDVYKFPQCMQTREVRENEIVPLCFSHVGAPPIRLDLVDDYGNVYEEGVHLDYSHRPSFVYLFVNVTRKMDGFLYRCRARSPYFRYYEAACLLGPINVIKKPSVHLEPLQSTVNLADDVRYLCKVESEHPVLEYKWKIHPSIDKSRVSYFDNNRVIMLSDISKNDENTLISCSVRTDAGTTTATTKLKINTPETILVPETILAPTTTMTITKIMEQPKISTTERIYNEQKTITHSTEHRTTFTETNFSSLPVFKTAEGGNIILALCALIIFQFMVILLACVFFRTRTKTGVKLPIQTEFQVTASTPVNPV